MSKQAVLSLKIACCSGDDQKVRHILLQTNLADFLNSSEGNMLLRLALKNSIFSELQLDNLGVEREFYVEQFLSKFLSISKLLVQHGVKVNNDNPQENSDTSLHLAVKTQSTEIIEMLISKGAVVNAQNHKLDTPLHIAVQKNSINIAELLLKNGANPEIANGQGYKIIHLIIQFCDENMVNIFLQNAKVFDFSSPSNQNLLQLAVKRGSLKMIQFILDHTDNIEQEDENGATVLQTSVKIGNLGIVKLLLEKGSNINTTAKLGKTPLHIAVENGLKTIVQLLFDYNVDINIKDDSSMSPLHLACVHGNVEIVKLLLDKGCFLNQVTTKMMTPLHAAIVSDHENVVELLLNYGADVNIKDSKGLSPLHMAVKVNSEKMVSLLLEKGCDINATTNRGSTPLHLSVDQDYCDCSISIKKLLLEKDANLQAKDNQGLIPLNYAVKYKNLEDVGIILDKNPDKNNKSIKSVFFLSFVEDEEEDNQENEFEERKSVAELFVDRGFNIHVEDFNDAHIPEELYSCLLNRFKNGKFRNIVENILNKEVMNDPEEINKSCLMYVVLVGAVKYCFMDIVNNLMTQSININASLETGETLLHIASKNGHVLIVKELLRRGADVNAVNLNKMSALHLSVMCNNLSITMFLLEKKADIEACNQQNRTPLFLAVQENNYHIIRLLLNAGANVNCVDVKKRSPLHEAVNNGVLEIIELLLFSGASIETKNSFEVMPILKILENQTIFSTDVIDMLFNYGANMIDLNPEIFNDPRKCEKLKIKSAVSGEDCSDFLANSTMKDFQIVCQKEIDKMKVMKIYGFNIAVHDLLIKPENKIAAYMRNKSMVQILDKIDFEIKFPVFANKLKVRVMKGKMNNHLLDLGHHCLEVFLKMKIPIVVIQEVFSYLDEIDLRRLIIASPICNEKKRSIHFRIS